MERNSLVGEKDTVRRSDCIRPSDRIRAWGKTETLQHEDLHAILPLASANIFPRNLEAM